MKLKAIETFTNKSYWRASLSLLDASSIAIRQLSMLWERVRVHFVLKFDRFQISCFFVVVVDCLCPEDEAISQAAQWSSTISTAFHKLLGSRTLSKLALVESSHAAVPDHRSL